MGLHLPLLHHHHTHSGVPRGCLPVKVGREEERFVVPVDYFNHPLFAKLLDVAEEAYGFGQEGTLRLPCHVAEFTEVRRLIDREAARGRHHHHHSPLAGCFKV